MQGNGMLACLQVSHEILQSFFAWFCVVSLFAGSKNCALQDAKLNSVLHSNRAAVGLKMGEYLKAEVMLKRIEIQTINRQQMTDSN